MNTKSAIVLANLGTPENCTKSKVRKFLSEFLNDRFVIDLPYLARKILVNLIIVPFRAAKSTKMYQQIWTKEGSPILIHSQALVSKMNEKYLGKDVFFLAMRYGMPSLEKVLKEVSSQQYNEIVLVSLFPQFANSTTGSVLADLKRIRKKLNINTSIRTIEYFYEHPAFINVWANRIRSLNPDSFDHVLFVFHGLPVKQVEKMHTGNTCQELDCKNQLTPENKMCYHAQSYHNARLLAAACQMDEFRYSVCFQSRFGKNWLMPYADQLIKEKADLGVKNMLIVPLSFVADCLETKLEIEIEYAHLFKSLGGEKLQMAESLNSGEDWVDALGQIIYGA